jgi:SPFH domain / Band 7 family
MPCAQRICRRPAHCLIADRYPSEALQRHDNAEHRLTACFSTGKAPRWSCTAAGRLDGVAWQWSRAFRSPAARPVSSSPGGGHRDESAVAPISRALHIHPNKAPPKATAPLEGECDMFGFEALIVVIILGVIGLALSARTVKQYERGLVFRFGRVRENIRGPGLVMIVPGMDRLRKVNMQIVTMAIPAQDGITRDNVTVRVDAVFTSGSSIP